MGVALEGGRPGPREWDTTLMTNSFGNGSRRDLAAYPHSELVYFGEVVHEDLARALEEKWLMVDALILLVLENVLVTNFGDGAAVAGFRTICA